jgi:hypothetical protein
MEERPGLALGSSSGTLLESEAVRGPRSSRRDGARLGLRRDARRRRLVSIVACASEGRRLGGAHLRQSRTIRPLASLARGPLPGLGSAPSGAGWEHAQTGRSSRTAGGREWSWPSLDADLPGADRCRCRPRLPAPHSCLPRSSPRALARPRRFRVPQAAEPSRCRFPALGPTRSTGAAPGEREPRPRSFRPVGQEAGSRGRRCRRGTPQVHRVYLRGCGERRSPRPAHGSCGTSPASSSGRTCGFHVSTQTQPARLVFGDGAHSGWHRPSGDDVAQRGLTRYSKPGRRIGLTASA